MRAGSGRVTVKSTTTIRIDSELLRRAKELGLNVSAASAEGIAAAIERASAARRSSAKPPQDR